MPRCFFSFDRSLLRLVEFLLQISWGVQIDDKSIHLVELQSSTYTPFGY